jgi:hypothetical protein
MNSGDRRSEMPEVNKHLDIERVAHELHLMIKKK